MTMHLANRYQQIADPTVMKLLELSNRPGIISFAGGTPAPETFPTKLLDEAARSPLPLQYSSAQGIASLREVLSDKFSHEWGRVVSPEHILITTGSQQALDLVGRTYLDNGDTVLCEDPTYFVALYAFSAYDPVYQIVDWRKPRSLKGAKLAYLVPTFGNPTGRTLTSIERQVVGELVSGGETILMEDDPYSQLYFGRKPPLPIAATHPHNVIYITTLSKIVGPALRMGVVIAEPEIISALTRVKSGMDLCTSALTQTLTERTITDPRFSSHLETIRKYYGRKARAMFGALKKYMPSGVVWVRPQGGMFVWVTLPSSVDSNQLYTKAIDAGIAFVPGYIFRPGRKRSSSLRLSFAMASVEEIDRGIKILAKLVREEVANI